MLIENYQQEMKASDICASQDEFIEIHPLCLLSFFFAHIFIIQNSQSGFRFPASLYFHYEQIMLL